ncbi:glycine zipper 2TM domain-containing protein [Ramlibacter sp. 2FC]|uniref:glycine zipper 2TM domain-containing protein n=1 Tax=Ramlibacter sp. 2FC TaxID=2502188 RepID=UPI0010F798BE|nr:glycine zipper 2TM domain-containing protein [Ramlibacter sp. 2FC]
MKHAMAFALLLPLAGAALADEFGRVLSSSPIVQQVAVPRQVCETQQVLTPAPRSGAGAVMGALAGGAVGNAVGNGGGRALATMIGLVGGAMVGDQIEGGGQAQVQNVQQCGTQTFYEQRTVGYDVVYEYAGKQYQAQMPSDPGPTVRLQVSPISMPPPPGYTPVAPQQPYGMSSTTTYYPTAPVYAAPTVAYPGHYPARPYYDAPAPGGLSLNFGYVRHGGRH